MEAFSYDPIDRTRDSLRLLILLPRQASDKSDEICCELVHHTFASKPVYDALSYTWGQDSAGTRIKVNGRPFFIRKNLFHALSGLRSYHQSRTLWIDAVCINQDDIHERNSQVSLMAFIFTRAQRVLVWLGLRKHDLQTLYLKKDKPPRVHEKHDSEYFSEEVTILGPRNSTMIAINPYWTRLWIIQEIILAREVLFLFGNYKLSWEDMISEYNLAISRKILNAASPIMLQRQRRHTNALLLETIIETFQDAQCSETRDKIFGFLGIAHDCVDSPIEVDYEMNYFDLYATVIEFQQSRKPIRESSLRPEVDRSARLIKFSQLIQKVLGGMVDRDLRAGVPTKDPDQRFIAKGVIVGHIIHIGPTYDEMVSSSNANKEWRKALEDHYQKNERDLFKLRENDTAYYQRALSWNDRYVKKIRNISSKTSFGYQDPFTSSFRFLGDGTKKVNRAGSTVESIPRRFLGTNGLTGFVPPHAVDGDLLCCFWDCDVTVILRRYKSHMSDTLFTIVGRADLGPSDEHYMEWKTSVINHTTGVMPDGSDDHNKVLYLKLDIQTLQQLTD